MNTQQKLKTIEVLSSITISLQLQNFTDGYGRLHMGSKFDQHIFQLHQNGVYLY